MHCELTNGIAKLQAQVNRLREDLEMQRSHRQELSEEILSNARERLQQLQHAVSDFCVAAPARTNINGITA